MGMRFLHGTFHFKVLLLLILVIALSPVLPSFLILPSLLVLPSFRAGAGRAYAAPWFTTYGGGVLSGSVDADGIKSIQPYFDPVSSLFKSSLIQPGAINPNTIPPDDTYDFSYGGIITRGNYDVKKTNLNGTTGATDDAFAKNMGVLGDLLPNYQRFLDLAESTGSCTTSQLFTCSTLLPGKLYKASWLNINASLITLNGAAYNMGGAGTGGLFIFVIDDTAAPTLTILKNIPSNSTSERLILITSGKIEIKSGVGNANTSNQGTYLTQGADIQAMFVSTLNGSPSILLDTGANPLKVEGPMITKGKISIKRQLGVNWPPVFVQFNPFYTAEFAKLAGSLNIFGPSTARWSYE